jgi:hypothetical protein
MCSEETIVAGAIPYGRWFGVFRNIRAMIQRWRCTQWVHSVLRAAAAPVVSLINDLQNYTEGGTCILGSSRVVV